MTGDHLYKRFFFSPWFLAIFPSILIFIFMSPYGNKYSLVVEQVGKDYTTDYYADLNSDGKTELLRYGKGLPYYHLVFLDNNIRVFDQWNFEEDLDPVLAGITVGDIDSDGNSEVFVFTCRDDSLFLNVNEFFEKGGFYFRKEFITKVAKPNNTYTSFLYPAGFYDVNGDGISEFYFCINTGFGLEPRLCYYFDVKNRHLVTSKFTGISFIDPLFIDSDGDGKPELFGMTSASGNYKVSTPFSDQSSWHMIYNERLEFEFPPVEYPGMTNVLKVLPYQNSKFRGYLLFLNTGSADTAIPKPRIMINTLRGEIIKERIFEDLDIGSVLSVHQMKRQGSDRIFAMGRDMVELNSDLEIINRTKAPFSNYYNSFVVDIDLNNESELLLYSPVDKKLAVFDNMLKMIGEEDIDMSAYIHRFSHKIAGKDDTRLFWSNNVNSCFINIVKNDFYIFSYLFYPGIYVFLVLIIGILFRIAVERVQHNENLKQRLLTLQLQGIKSQLDPHFTFNSLNSIASLIYLEDRQTAYDYLNKFTSLLRGMLNDAERIYRTLGEEIEFVTTYLELEKMRFGDKLEFSISVADEVSGEEKVPKLVMHTFAENAIKHGIIPSLDGGKLKITVDKESDYMRIIIEDNGIGRVKAAGQSLSTGKGLKLTGEFYDILNQLNKKPITHSITDLYDDSGAPCGTRVEVYIPVA
jgi:two-component sensor histidine kinase